MRRTTAALACALLAAAVPLLGATPRPHRPFCPPGPPLAACVARRLGTPVRWSGRYEPLDRLLRAVARRAFVPMSIVLARPLPNVALPSGLASPAAELDAVVRTHRAYRWWLDDGVLRFEDARLVNDRQNFLNWRLRSYTIAPDVGDDALILSQLLWQWPRPSVNAIDGLHPRIVGRPARLTLRGATGGAALLRLLRAAPTFYSQIIFPAHRGPLTHKQALEAVAGWRWTPLTQPPIPPPPPPCGPYQIPPNAPPNWTPPPGTPCHPGAHPS